MIRTLAAALATSTCIVALATPAAAQTREYNIPAGSLKSALDAYVRQSGRQIVYRVDQVRSARSPGTRGQKSAEAALAAILVGSGFTSRIDGNLVAIVKAEGNVADAEVAPSSGEAPSYSQDIVVTAQKRNERLQDVPISVTVLTGQSLDRTTSEGVRDALVAVPSVAVFTDYLGSGTNTTIRGVSAAFPHFTGSSTVAYYLDTVPFGLVTNAFGPDASAYDLDRVEVLRGPQGTLYGSSALNGVVRILTHEANPDDYEIKVRGLVSDTHRGGINFRGDGAVNVPIVEGKLALRAVAGYQNNSGWIDQPNNHDSNKSETQTYRLKLNAQPTDALSLSLFTWISRFNAGAPSFGYTNYKMSSVRDQSVTTDYDVYGMTLSYEFSGFVATSATSYLDYKNISNLGLDAFQFGFPDTDYFTRIDSHVFSEEVNLHSRADGNWRWSAGGIYRRGRDKFLQTYSGVLAAVPFPASINTSESYALYGEVTRLLFDRRIELTAGFRHFHDTETNQSQNGSTPLPNGRSVAKANTPRVVLTWHPTKQHMLYASYSEGFRSGYPQGGALLATYPDFPALRPDRLQNYEIGAKGSFWNNRLGYDVAVYHTKWKDIQQQLTLPYAGSPAGVGALVNAGSASGNGFDISLFARPADGLTLNGSVSWNDLSFDKDVITLDAAGIPQVLFSRGARPSGSPSTTASGSAEYQFALGSDVQATLAASLTYTSKIAYRGISLGAITDLGVSDPMTIGKVSFRVEAPQNWSATLFVDNVNNWNGVVARTFVGVDDWNARVRPRTYGIQFEYKY